MATFTTTRTATGVAPRYQEKGVFCDVATYEFAGEAAGSIIQLVKVAPNVTVLDGYIIYDDLGTLTVDVGDGDDADRYIDGADVGAAAGLSRFALGAGGLVFPRKYTAEDTVDLLTITGAATGTLTAVVFMTAEPVDLV